MGRYKDKEKLNQRKKQAYEFFISKGYTPEQSSGIVGNLIQESNLRTEVISSFEGEGSFGIAQWNPSSKAGNRLGKLKSFAKERGTKPGDFDTQLEFIAYELDTIPHLGKSKLKNARNAQEAATVFSNHYERPNKKYAHLDKRAANAKAVFLEFNDNNIYAKDENNKVVSVDPEVATPKDVEKSTEVKRELYERVFNIPNPRPKQAEPAPVVEAKEEISKTKSEVEFKNKVGDILRSMASESLEEVPQQRSFNYEPSQIGVQENEYFNVLLPQGSDGGTIDPKKKPKREVREVSKESTSVRMPKFQKIDLKKQLEKKEVDTETSDSIDKILSKADFSKKDIDKEFIPPMMGSTSINLESSNNRRSFRVGDRGNEVRKIQQFLVDSGTLKATSNRGKSSVDGVYGAQTKRAIEQFQKDRGLTVDGILGKETLKAMNSTRDKKVEDERLMNPKVASTTSVRKPIVKPGFVKVKEERDLSLIRKGLNSIPLMARQFIHDSFGGDDAITENHLNDGELQALKDAVKYSIMNKTDRITYDTWRAVGSGGEDTRTDDVNFLNPATSLQKTLGQANIIQEDNGDIYVVDRYNFNDAGDKKNRNKNKYTDDKGLLPLSEATSFSNGIYRVARNFKTEYGSSEGGSPSKIFVGNVKDF